MGKLFITVASLCSLLAGGSALVYYRPDLLPSPLFDWLVKAVHHTTITQNVTFVLVYVSAVFGVLAWIMLAVHRPYRLYLRRKRLTTLFDKYGAQFAAQDKEINF